MYRFICSAALTTLALQASAPSQVTPLFAVPEALETPHGPIDAEQSVFGDFDGDGRVDVFWQTGVLHRNVGGLWAVDATQFPNPASPIAAADFDGDGRDDILDTTGLRVADAGISLSRYPGPFARTPLTFSNPYAASTLQDLAIGDFDGDGDLDIVLGSSSLQLHQLVNDGAGGFTDATGTRMAFAVSTAHLMFAADVDADGDLDLIVENGPRAVSLNDGTGRFSRFESAAIRTSGRDILNVADLNGDGAADLITSAGEVLNGGTGTFVLGPSSGTLLPLQNAARVEFGDLDGDGDPDAWVENSAGARPTIEWFTNPGIGNGPWIRSTAPLPNRPRSVDSIRVIDFDGNGRADILSSHNVYLRRPRVNVLLSQPTGAFLELNPVMRASALASNYGDFSGDGIQDELTRPYLRISDGFGNYTELWANSSFDGFAMASGDIDADGDRDLISRRILAPDEVMLNDGSGTFTSQTGITTYDVRWAELADLDGDGDQDLIAGTTDTGHSLSVYTWEAPGQYRVRPSWQLNLGDGWNVDGAVFDADHDGDLDTVVGAVELELFRNDGAGRQSAAAGAFPTGLSARGLFPGKITHGDVDGDGDQDLLVLNVYSTTAPLGVDAILYANDGSGQFTERTVFRGSLRWERAELRDVDMDGAPDIVVGASRGDRIVDSYETFVLLNDGNGAMTRDPRPIPGFGRSFHFVIADVDGDGDPDLVDGFSGRFAINRTRHLDARGQPRVGGSIYYEIPNPTANARSAILLISLAALPTPIPFADFGTLVAAPAAGVGQLLSLPAGSTANLAVPIPNNTAVGGQSVYAQALLDPTTMPRLTAGKRSVIAF